MASSGRGQRRARSGAGRCAPSCLPLRLRRSSPRRASSGVTARGVDVGDEPAAQDHLDACRTGRSARRGRREISSTASPSRAGLRGCGPRSPPGRRRRRRGSGARRSARIGLAAHLPADDELLLVAAGQRGRRATSMPGVRTSYCVDDPLGVRRGRRPRSIHGPLTLGACGLVAEDPVLPERRLEQQPVPVPVLGDVADARLAPRAGRPGGDVGAAEADPCRPRAPRMPMIASTSSAWPLPSTPAMPSTSPRWIVKLMSSSSARPSAERTVRPATVEHRLGR